jgi:hypothetical protein
MEFITYKRRNLSDGSYTTTLVIQCEGKFYVNADDVDFFNVDTTSKFPDYDFESSISVELGYTQNLETVLASLGMVEIQPIEIVYNRLQHFGGQEEGGWYYHTQEATDLTLEQADLLDKDSDFDHYGQGYFVIRELVKGENNDTKKPFYC